MISRWTRREWDREGGQRVESLAGRMAPPEEVSLSGLMFGHKEFVVCVGSILLPVLP